MRKWIEHIVWFWHDLVHNPAHAEARRAAQRGNDKR